MSKRFERLSTGRMLLGLTAASIAGLSAYIAIMIFFVVFMQVIAVATLGAQWESLPIGEVVIAFGLFGFPLALLMTLVIGLPVWKRAEAKTLRSARHSVLLGGLVGLLIGLVFLLLNLASGLSIYFSDSSYDAWSGEIQTTSDGLPTLFGWLAEALQLCHFAASGAVGGVVARLVTLPRNKPARKRD